MRKTLAVLTVIVASHTAFAATKFVRPTFSGTHNGTTWTTAWNDLSGVGALAAGDVLCMAGGTYAGGLNISTGGATGNPITYRRAIAADPVCGSTSSGWTSGFDAQVSIPAGIAINSVGNITISGNGVANGISTIMAPAACNVGPFNDCPQIDILGPAPNVILTYVESGGPCGSVGCTVNGTSHNIRIGHNFVTVANFLLDHMNLHGGCDNMQIEQGTGVVQYTRFADSVNNLQGGSVCHENVIEGGEGGITVTLRYSEWTNWTTEGIMMCPTNPGCPTETWTIYGNIFHDAVNNGNFPRFFELQNSSNATVIAYDNTYAKAGTFGCFTTANGGGTLNPGSAAFNNMYFGSYHSCGWPSPIVEDFGASDGATGMAHGQNNITSAFFVNSAAKTVAGWNLSQHTTAGSNLGSPYNIDYNGNTRTTWDRGFVEFASGGGATLVSITLTPVAINLYNGQFQTISAACLWSDSTTVCPTLSWVSGTPAVATVSSSGVVTGVSLGSASITASANSITSNATAITEFGPAPAISVGIIAQGPHVLSGQVAMR